MYSLRHRLFLVNLSQLSPCFPPLYKIISPVTALPREKNSLWTLDLTFVTCNTLTHTLNPFNAKFCMNVGGTF